MQTAVVTGASRGIGRCIAELLVRDGIRVYMLARGEADLQHAALPMGDLGRPIVCDVTNPDLVERAVYHIAQETQGAPDILINNAGIFPLSPLHTLSDAGT